MDRQGGQPQETINEDGTSLSLDANADGNPELTAVDINKDGKADALIIDADSDGTPDGVMIDLDGDGKADIALVDSDGDGVIDSLATTQNEEEAAGDPQQDDMPVAAPTEAEVPVIIDVDDDIDGSLPEEEEDQDEAAENLQADGTAAAETGDAGAQSVETEEPGLQDSPEAEEQAVTTDDTEQQDPQQATEQAVETESAPAEDFSHKVADVRYEDKGSGHVDTASIDRDGDGWFEETKSISLEDRDADGARDSAYADLNNDGWQEKVGEDTDRDGVMNAMDDGSGFISRDALLHDGESRTVDENLKEVSGENDADTHDGWNARTETVDSEHSMRYDSQGHVTIVDADGDETQLANIDDVTHRVGTEGDAATENVGIDHDGYAANVFVDGAGDHATYGADDSAGYDASADSSYAAPADTASSYDAGSSAEADTSYDA
jgi:hypothetical protein